MANELVQRIYTAEAEIRGGRQGRGRTSDGLLDLKLDLPDVMGGNGDGANAEQLFALGYGVSFQTALEKVAAHHGVDATESIVTTRVTVGRTKSGARELAVEIEVRTPHLDRETAETIVRAAHEICPYSNATYGNIEVSVGVIAVC